MSRRNRAAKFWIDAIPVACAIPPEDLVDEDASDGREPLRPGGEQPTQLEGKREHELAQGRGELRGAVLHPGAAEPAGDLAGALEKHGVEARRLILYETAPVQLPDAEAQIAIRCDAVLLHSARAAQVMARMMKVHPAPTMRALGLSKAVVKPLARTRLAAKAFPPFPLEAALLNLIDRRP